MTVVLYLAASPRRTTSVWGAVVVLFPRRTLELLGVGDLNYPQFWQCIGMIVGVYGVAYAMAAGADPVTHRGIVLVGMLGKIFGPVGFVMSVTRGELPAALRRDAAVQRPHLVGAVRADPATRLASRAARRRQVKLLDVLADHAVRVEDGATVAIEFFIRRSTRGGGRSCRA